MAPDQQTARYRVLLIGPVTFFNDAITYVIEREIAASCEIVRDGLGPSLAEAVKDAHKVLVLIDGQDRDVEKELFSLGAKDGARGEAFTVAVFNLQKGTGIERRAFNLGVRGFFYRSDSLSQVLKGLHSLLQGEIWVSRGILTQVALQGRFKRTVVTHDKTALSHREMEIMALLSIGSSNDDISEKLFISPNTVKTHLYRIFRKIKVPNRFQAALWAAKNL